MNYKIFKVRLFPIIPHFIQICLSSPTTTGLHKREETWSCVSYLRKRLTKAHYYYITIILPRALKEWWLSPVSSLLERLRLFYPSSSQTPHSSFLSTDTIISQTERGCTVEASDSTQGCQVPLPVLRLSEASFWKLNLHLTCVFRWPLSNNNKII